MRYFRYLFVLLAIFILAIVAIVYAAARAPKTNGTALTALKHAELYDSEDNGWHDIEAALDLIHEPDQILQEELAALRSADSVSPEALTFLENQQEALELTHKGLQADYLIVPRYDVTNTTNLQIGERKRALARALVWDGYRLEVEDKPAEAVRRYLDTIALGHWNANGGVLIDDLISIAIQRIGLEPLLAIIPVLDASELEVIVTELKLIEAAAVPFSNIAATERAVFAEDPNSNFVQRLVGQYMIQDTLRDQEKSHQFAQTRIIGTRLRAQVTLHTLNTGQAPATLAEVLGTEPIPIDPETGNPFELTPQGTITAPGQRNHRHIVNF